MKIDQKWPIFIETGQFFIDNDHLKIENGQTVFKTDQFSILNDYFWSKVSIYDREKTILAKNGRFFLWKWSIFHQK